MAGAVGGVIIAGSMKSLSLSLQSAQVVKSSLSESDLRHSIGQVLNNSADCLANFKPTGATAPSDPEQASSIGLYGADREWGVGQIVRLVKTQGNTDNSDDTALLKKGVAFKGDLTIVKMELKGTLPSPKDGTTKLTKQTAFRSFLVYYKKERMGAYSTLGGKDCTDTDQSGCYFNQCQIEYRQDDPTTSPNEGSCSVSDCVNYGSGGSGGTVACYTADTENDDISGKGQARTLVGCGGTSNNQASWTTALGFEAGSQSTGVSNTFVGTQAGQKNTGGASNTFVGSAAGQNNTSGSVNTFIGYATGSNNTTGRNNTFIGYMACSGNATGNYNTCLGDSAGRNNWTGNYNTFIGYNTGSQSDMGTLERVTNISDRILMKNPLHRTTIMDVNVPENHIRALGTLQDCDTDGRNCKQVAKASQPCSSTQYSGGFDSNGNQVCRSWPFTGSCSLSRGEYLGGFDFNGRRNCRSFLFTGSCSSSQYVKGFYRNGAKKCSSWPFAGSCSPNQYVSGFNSSGSRICRALPTPTTPQLGSCPSGQYLRGFNSNGSRICVTLPLNQISDMTCPAWTVVAGIQNGSPVCKCLSGETPRTYVNCGSGWRWTPCPNDFYWNTVCMTSCRSGPHGNPGWRETNNNGCFRCRCGGI